MSVKKGGLSGWGGGGLLKGEKSVKCDESNSYFLTVLPNFNNYFISKYVYLPSIILQTVSKIYTQ